MFSIRWSVLLASLGLGLVAGGCGIRTGIGSDAKYQQPLAAMHVIGTPAEGQPLQVDLDYQQTYPVNIDVECDLDQNSEVVQTIGTDVVPGSPQARPDATPIPGKFTFPFQVQAAGSYQVVCFTPADVENKLKSSLSVAAR